ncbi:hypothetical protein BPAE_0065g00280 [Botrytis paeoniae]|uniref:Uncharacterized protein n=1 Tax=Botrytis paeoniae TaxID=278948 RepID=A0A4Z1FT68_9HELO|nr:hypothetical protein BPAE_0065g00280 [Botrytis paeoniae]
MGHRLLQCRDDVGSTLILTPSVPVILSDYHFPEDEITASLVSVEELGEDLAFLLITSLSETYCLASVI